MVISNSAACHLVQLTFRLYQGPIGVWCKVRQALWVSQAQGLHLMSCISEAAQPCTVVHCLSLCHHGHLPPHVSSKMFCSKWAAKCCRDCGSGGVTLLAYRNQQATEPGPHSFGPHSCGGRITASPPMNGRSTSGTSTLPSACWYVSRMAISSRGTAHAVAFSVWQNSVAPLRAGGLPAPSAARGLGLARAQGCCALAVVLTELLRYADNAFLPCCSACSSMFCPVCSNAVSHAHAAHPVLYQAPMLFPEHCG